MNIFKKIFKPKAEVGIPDLSGVLVDMHSHLIPGVDDGAKTMEDSIVLIKELISLGYKHFITTPHIMSDIYPNNAADLKLRSELVQQRIREENLDITFQVSAEYFLDEHFLDLIRAKDLLTFGDNHVLFELSFLEEPKLFQEAIFEMQSAGYKPILAHPERYPYLHNSFERYENLHKQGVDLQLNLNSLTGQYSPQVTKIAERLIEENLVTYLGSDCHHLGHIGLAKQALKNPWLKKLISSGFLSNQSLI